jgi:hypothetical protein
VLWIAIYHQRLCESKRFRFKTVPISFLLPTTEPHPTHYRPDYRKRLDPERVSRMKEDDDRRIEWEYMEDWSLAYGNSGPIMLSTPEDISGDTLPFDSGLEAINEGLDSTWQVWRQAAQVEEG